MQTYAERLASFGVAHPATKKRTSSAKSAKTLRWPHKTPAPLAEAGFVYRPTLSNPDNAVCFLCHTGIDGWESDDDPAAEHQKLSPDCGWAINVYIERQVEAATRRNEIPVIECPTSEKMFEARIATFGSRWPHEDKRGWICKTQKMAEAGWYYCPTEESDDYVRCPYCGLSMDGWEPKDNPYEVHQRRADHCRFFRAKSAHGRKARTSKASRMSTQSNLASDMEGVSIADTLYPRDESVMVLENDSVIDPKPGKKATRAKKTMTKPRGKAGKARTEESMQASSFLEPEDDNFDVKIAPEPTKGTRAKKRNSKEMYDISDATNVGDTDPPAKRRATRTKASNVQVESIQTAANHEQNADVQMTDSENMPPPAAPSSKKAGKGGRKRGSSTLRKASATSTASMASLRVAIPNDEEIEAALEADLDRPFTDEEGDEVPQPITSSKKRRLTKTKPASRNATASVAPTRRKTHTNTLPANIVHGPENLHKLEPDGAQLGLEPASQPQPCKGPKSRKASKKHADTDLVDVSSLQEFQAPIDESGVDVGQTTKSKTKRTRQASRQVAASKPRASEDSIAHVVEYPSLDMNSSALGSRTAEDDSGQETHASVADQAPRKRGRKKGTKKTKVANKAGSMIRNIEDIVQPEAQPEVSAEQPHADAMVVDEPEPAVSAEQPPADAMVGDDTELEVPAGQPSVDAMAVDEPHPVEVEVTEAAAPAKATRKKTAKSTKTKTAKAKPVEEPLSPAPMTDEPWADQILGESTPIPAAVVKVPATSPTHFVRATTPAVPDAAVEEPSKVLPAQRTPRPVASPQSSDAENQPPSFRPSALRPPLIVQSPSNAQTIRIPLAPSTPTTSPSKRNISKLQTSIPWMAVDYENFFVASPNAEKESMADPLNGALTSPEKRLTVEEWIYQNARKGEEKLRNQCERLVGKFEGEGVRALKSLEGIGCSE